MTSALLTAGAVMPTQMPQHLNNVKSLITANAADTGSRIRVDINKNDGRKASYSKNANNWLLVDGTSASYTVGSTTFKLSNGGSVGGNVRGVNNKKLQLQSGVYPRMTMDGAKIDNGDNGGILKLEISGLSNSRHSLQMWHCNNDGYSNSTLSVSVNGKKVASGIKCPTNVTSENDAGISYVTWSGSSATILISPEGGGKQNVAWLNGFELDGSDPFNGVSNMYPADQEKHFEKTNKISWKAGTSAKSHNIYIGKSYDSVYNASTDSPEFKGNQVSTNYALDNTYSSIPTYYWRVDEVNDKGVVKGAVYSFQTARVAFPTAEGAGRYARGGRGGYVYHVTNLNDSGEGSLRYGLETMKGARTVVFDVGGTIQLKSVLCVPDDGGDVYIAGQTAPGDGVALQNYTFGALGSSDVVIRDIRTFCGDVSGKSMGGMGIGSCDYCIIDHCSVHWATDEGFSSRSASNITFQWNIIGESLNNSVHYNAGNRSDVERHSFAASISGYTGTFHHNLLIDNTGRNWSLAGGMEQDGSTYGGQLVIADNVVYNWQGRTTDGGVHRLDFVNNTYKAGAVSNTDMHIASIDGNELNTSDMQKMYVSGNQMLKTDGSAILKSTDDAWAAGKAVCGNKNATVNDVKSTKPFLEPYYFGLESANDSYSKVIKQSGANMPKFDKVDSRYQNEVKNGKYTYTGSRDNLKGIIDTQSDAEGYPVNWFKGGTLAKDSDGDGMSDEWEIKHGLNANNPKDGTLVSLSADDYTNLEMYLNELAGDKVIYNAAKEPELLNGTLIKSLSVNDADNFADWSIQNNLKNGDAIYGDRTVTFTNVPDSLAGAEWIRTACDSKAYQNNLATFTAGDDISAFVAIDSRMAVIPQWLSGWKNTGVTISASNDVVYNVYQSDFKSGASVTLGSNSTGTNVVNYFAAVTKVKTITNTTTTTTMTTTTTTTVSKAPTLDGDANVDGKVDISDVVAVRRYVSNSAKFPLTETGMLNADILNRGDGVGAQDAVRIQQIILGII
jgi:hypothetical protein